MELRAAVELRSAQIYQMIKGQLQWKKSNRQNYKRRVVYL